MSAQVITLPRAAATPVQNPPRRGRLPKSIPTLIRGRSQKQQALREVKKRLEIALKQIRFTHSLLPRLEADAEQARAEIARLTTKGWG